MNKSSCSSPRKNRKESLTRSQCEGLRLHKMLVREFLDVLVNALHAETMHRGEGKAAKDRKHYTRDQNRNKAMRNLNDRIRTSRSNFMASRTCSQRREPSQSDRRWNCRGFSCEDVDVHVHQVRVRVEVITQTCSMICVRV